MIDRRKIEELVRQALADVRGSGGDAPRVIDSSGTVLLTPDRGANLGTPSDPAALAGMLAAQPARIAVGRAGARYRTNTLLRFRADHAAARDAVQSEVDPKLLERLGMFEVKTRATDKRHFLQR